MPLTPDLRFALAALDMSLATRDQVLWSVAGWLKSPDGESLEARLCREAELDETCVFSIREVVEGGGPKSVDATVRDALAALSLPPDAKAWLAALPPRGARAVFAPSAPGERYRLGAPIASGGLGRVFEAEDRDLGRGVALKLLKDGCTAHDEERFLREARLAARLEHPVIVPTYDFGAMSDGRGGRKLYLCMKRIRGRDLARLLDSISEGQADPSWTRGRLLSVVQDVCLGIAYAHSKGVIHRDLKPSNIMVGEFGETMIVDWGIAKDSRESREESGEKTTARPAAADQDSTRDESSTHLTLAGSVMGTPSYMAPEQAEGRLDDIDARSDVYGLGGILYAVLSWQAPDGKQPPSARVRAALAAGERAPDPVPAELDALCRKAMAPRREDRFQTALDMNRELQFFLDGVRERERRAEEAAERVAAGRALLEKYRALETAIRDQAAEIARLAEEIPRHEGAAAKRPLWEAQAARGALEEERIAAYAAAAAEFGQARAVDAGCEAAADGLADLYLARLGEAERRRDRGEELLLRNQVAHLGRAARLEAPGKLTLRTKAFPCPCLAPVRDPAWRVEIDEALSLTWRDGAPRPGVAPLATDRMVPAQRQIGGRWGHGPDCRAADLNGAEVRLARYETRDLRLVPGPERVLGRTPLENVLLPPGSYRCTLAAPGYAPVHVPVLIRRGEPWEQDVVLYRPDEIPKGFMQVPGGPFSWGGAFAGGTEEMELRTQDVFIAKFSVTAGEYLEFLNALVQQGRFDEARRCAPREAAERFLRETPSGFELAPPGDPSALSHPDFPATGLSWHDAVAYAAWRGTRDGLPLSLPTEDEWEKAARGVDRRIYPFGDDFDPSFAHIAASVPAAPHLLPVGSFPADESPYGLRDTAGSVSNWLLNGVEIPYRHYRGLRGGGWFISPAHSRIVYRRAIVPEATTRYYGVRVCVRPGVPHTSFEAFRR